MATALCFSRQRGERNDVCWSARRRVPASSVQGASETIWLGPNSARTGRLSRAPNLAPSQSSARPGYGYRRPEIDIQW